MNIRTSKSFMWAILLSSLTLAASPPSEAGVEGDWANPSRTVVVRIVGCGAALCGHVVEASEAARQDALRGGTASLIGTQVLFSFVPAGPDRWKGLPFVPDKAIRARARIIFQGTDKLSVVACEPIGVLCRKQVWRRVPT